MPRARHLEVMLHVFVYLKINHNLTMIFDPSYPEVDKSSILKVNWTEFYGNMKELIPGDVIVLS